MEMSRASMTMHAYEYAGDEVPIMREYNYEGHNHEGITMTRMCSTSTRLIHTCSTS